MYLQTLCFLIDVVQTWSFDETDETPIVFIPLAHRFEMISRSPYTTNCDDHLDFQTNNGSPRF